MKTQSEIVTRLTLKSFKPIASMSQETVCFTANIYLDGKLIGEAANEGHGGCTFVHFVNANAEATAKEFAKSINPADVKGWEFLADKGFTFDCLVDIAVQAECKKKDDAKIIKKARKNAVEKTTFLTVNCKKGEYRAYKTPTNDLNRATRIANAKANADFKCFVADMTDAEILAHFAY